MDRNGGLYYENKWVTEKDLKARLRRAVSDAGPSLVLIVHADEAVTYKMLVNLTLAARDAGISEALLATLPGPVNSPAAR
jgi:biopolymer transport protein ExbD